MAYLARVLIRRLLTALALITGLAATGAPASAAMIDAVSEQVEAGASGSQDGRQAPCECAFERGRDPMKQSPRVRCTRVRAPLTIFIPTVQFGPDRALE